MTQTSIRFVRPWGHYEVLREAAVFKLKLISVQPGQRLSLQRHRHRHEHWYVLSGRAEVRIDALTQTLDPGDAVNIPQQCWHRLSNRSASELVLIEVQTGSYFGEDDIERQSDDYGRALGDAGER